MRILSTDKKIITFYILIFFALFNENAFIFNFKKIVILLNKNNFYNIINFERMIAMDFEWSTNDIAKKTVTIYNTNLTLNKAACRHFEDVNYVLLGLDQKNNLLGIKPVQKQEIDSQIYPEDQLHRISIGKSYGRISNKTFINELSQIYRLDLSDNKYYKYDARFDVIHQILLVNL